MHSAPQHLTLKNCAHVLTAPGEKSHKYSRGVLGLLTGSETYPGAALISARAAVNSGAGLVRFIGNPHLNTLMHLSVPEAVCASETDGLEGTHVHAWAIGSGIAGATRENLAQQILLNNQPTIIDAGAIALAAQLVAAEGVTFTAHHIVTPHLGEITEAFTWLMTLNPHLLSELADIPTRHDIEQKPAYFASLLAQTMGVTVLLKGNTTTIADPSGQVYQVTGQSPWLATAGSGDTLTGILGTLLARYQAETAPEARTAQDYSLLAASGALIHGYAADLVPPEGARGPVPPTLVAEHLPEALAKTMSETAH